MSKRLSLLVFLALPLMATALPAILAAADSADDWAQMKRQQPRGYVCCRAAAALNIDGRLDEAAWERAAWTSPFVDIEGDRKPAPTYRTRAKMLWDDQFFYIAARLDEPHVWATLREHDAVIFHDNDFELFLDPDGDNHEYYEFEINALNTGWDLYLPKPYKDGGRADNAWEIPGLKSAVFVDGTLNNPADVDRSWTVELAIPWSALDRGRRPAVSPSVRERWRVNFSRVEWQHTVVAGKYEKVPKRREDNWVWSPQGIVDMHRPERWGYVEFSDAVSGEAPFRPDPALAARDLLMEIYHLQKSFHSGQGRWSGRLDELGLARESWKTFPEPPRLKLTDEGFLATLARRATDSVREEWHVRQDSRLWVTREDELLPAVASALELAGPNRPRIECALRETPADQKEGMLFLVTEMPPRDLKSLSAEFLRENVEYAYRAWQASPWKDRIPKDVFLNDILPYANINERRDRWRRDFFERCSPLVKEARSPGHAAALLNQRIFGLFKVRYSTQRAKANQSPYESIESGLASCTGLSVLLIDACRAVGVPARFVGTPLWVDKSGNHSWVEVWDEGWHFTGAAEPAGDKLDTAWFRDRASTALRDDRRHAIYAVSFKKTPTLFPMVWARGSSDVYAVNVTNHYARRANPQPQGSVSSVDPQKSADALRLLKDLLAQDAEKRGTISGQAFARTPLNRDDARQAETLLVEDHARRIRATRAGEMKEGRLRWDKFEMPFFVRVFGDKPEGGRSLYISMHGGGGAPKQVNDRQWENQKRLYSLKEGVYVVPRAPTDAWNMWHQEHIDPLFDRLIENLIVFEDVDPNRVYLLGYSAGGDGVYQLAPRMADRFAAAAMMAGHPNETSPLGLRNLPFAIHVGGKDAAYQHNAVAGEWEKKLADLKQNDPDGYPHLVKIYPDKGHWMDREDAAALPWMAQFQRNPLPSKIVWKQDDVTHTRFYWLAVENDQRKPRAEVIASRDHQHIDLHTDQLERLTLRFNDQMLDLDQPIAITRDGKPVVTIAVHRTIEVLQKTLDERGDPKAVFCAETLVQLPVPSAP